MPRTRRQRIVAGLCAVVFVAGLAVPLIRTQETAQAWWDNSWQYRRKITLSNNASGAVAHGDFVVRISLTTSNFTYANAQADGDDIRFVDADDSTGLDYEEERWTQNGTSEFWVKVPNLALGTADFIWLYYGNAGAADGQDAVNTWNNFYYGAVHHFSGTTSPQQDSTVNNLDTSMSNVTARGSATGKVAGANDHEASTISDIVAISDNAALDYTSSFMIEAWIRPESAATATHTVLSKGSSSTANYELRFVSTDEMQIRTYNGSVMQSATTNCNCITTNTFHKVVGTLDGGNLRIYVNGVLSAGPTAVGTPVANAGALYVGLDDVDNMFDGIIDEVRVSNGGGGATVHAERIEAMYNSENLTMQSFGTEQSRGSSIGTWWNSCYQNRRKIVINNSASNEDLDNFPLRVSLTGGTNIDYSKTKNAGEDIRFVDDDNSTALDYEIETWNEGGGTGTSEVWVRVPKIDANSITDAIYMYYNCSSASDGQNVTGVWNSGFAGVWHLKEDPSTAGSGGIDDSTSNNNNGTPFGSMPSGAQATGRIGGSIYLDGSNDAIGVPHHATLKPTSAITLSTWAYIRNFNTAWQAFVNTTSSGGYVIEEHSPSGTLTTSIRTGGAYRVATTSSTGMTPNQWYNLAATYDSTVGTVTLYVNGQSIATATGATGAIQYSATNSMFIGSDVDTGAVPVGAYADATMDETRVSSVARSADWVEAEYKAGMNTLNTFGSEETIPTPPTAPELTDLTTDVSLTPTFQLRAADAGASYLRYKIEVCSTSDCSSIVRTIDQTASQTGWSGQDAQTSTAYASSSTVTSSTLASHTYQSPALTADTTYYWRAYAIDPGDSNTWSSASSIDSFRTLIPPEPPAAPTLIDPAAGSTGVTRQPVFRLRTTDVNGNYLRYRIEVCSTSDCSSIVRTIDQTASQTGWSGQDAQSATAYAGSATIGGSTVAEHTWQTPYLNVGTTYYWRASAIDPSGNNTWSSASSIQSFVVGTNEKSVTGGTDITGGTTIW